MGKKYCSDALAAAHETALGLTEAGVMDTRSSPIMRGSLPASKGLFARIGCRQSDEASTQRVSGRDAAIMWPASTSSTRTAGVRLRKRQRPKQAK
jgi:hypothetical protein